MPQQGQQFTVIVADGVERFPIRVLDSNYARAIVITLQTDGRIPLDQRAVWCAPVSARTNISE